MTWAEVIRKLKAAGYVEFQHPTTGHEVWVAIHTKKEAGQSGNRIFREAGIR